MKTRKGIAAISITALVIFVTSGIVFIPKANKYRNAVRLMDEGQYEKASELFNVLGKFSNADAYLDYCTARIYAADGKYSQAEMYLDRIKYYHRLSSYDYPSGYKDFVKEVREQQQIAWQEARKVAEQRYQERVRTGIPFVGMYESDIGETTLGRPNGTPWHNYEMERGKRVEATIYEWIKDGYVVYTARCLHGTVEQVWDERAKPWKKVKSQGTSVRKNTSSPKAKEEEDPLDAKSYGNPEDFYDDNYYDFFDYEEAEDYYYEHGGT